MIILFMKDLQKVCVAITVQSCHTYSYIRSFGIVSASVLLCTPRVMPSSSSNDWRPAAVAADSLVDPLESPSRADVDAEAVSHADCMHLDQVGPHAWVITNTLTGERVELPPGQWGMELNEKTGQGAVVMESGDDHAEGEVRELDEVFKEEVYRTEADELWVVNGDTRTSLESLQTRFEQAEVAVQAGTSAAKYDLVAYVFRRRRELGQRVWWDVAQFHAAFKMNTHKGSLMDYGAGNG